jgi:hypothetical protein
LGSKCFGATISPIRTEPPATGAGAPDAGADAGADEDAGAGADEDAGAGADGAEAEAEAGKGGDAGAALLAVGVADPAHPPGGPKKSNIRERNRPDGMFPGVHGR